MMNDGLQDEYDEHRRLEEQLILSLDRFHGCGTFFIVVNYLVDTSAHGKKRMIVRKTIPILAVIRSHVFSIIDSSCTKCTCCLPNESVPFSCW
jgi:hypothetical protein